MKSYSLFTLDANPELMYRYVEWNVSKVDPWLVNHYQYLFQIPEDRLQKHCTCWIFFEIVVFAWTSIKLQPRRRYWPDESSPVSISLTEFVWLQHYSVAVIHSFHKSKGRYGSAGNFSSIYDRQQELQQLSPLFFIFLILFIDRYQGLHRFYLQN